MLKLNIKYLFNLILSFKLIIATVNFSSWYIFNVQQLNFIIRYFQKWMQIYETVGGKKCSLESEGGFLSLSRFLENNIKLEKCIRKTLKIVSCRVFVLLDSLKINILLFLVKLGMFSLITTSVLSFNKWKSVLSFNKWKHFSTLLRINLRVAQ